MIKAGLVYVFGTLLLILFLYYCGPSSKRVREKPPSYDVGDLNLRTPGGASTWPCCDRWEPELVSGGN